MTEPLPQPPKAPTGLSRSARALWKDVVGRFELTSSELALLTEAVRTVSDLDELDRIISAEGQTVDGRPHPCLVEARQQRQVLARLLASLRLPDEDGAQPQRRGTYRTPYNYGGS